MREPISYREMFNAYYEALDEGATPKDIVRIRGCEFVMGYLKYLLMHLKNKVEAKGVGVDDAVFTFVPSEAP